jgi:hypothetical protein
MQKKHAWEKLIKLTGNQAEDFKKITALLEQNKILLHTFKEEITVTGVKRIICEQVIQGYKVEAHFVQYETGEIFLTNAFVMLK